MARGQIQRPSLLVVVLLCLASQVKCAEALGTITTVGAVGGGALLIMVTAVLLSRCYKRRQRQRSLQRKAKILEGTKRRPDNGNSNFISKAGTSKSGSTSVLHVPIVEMRRSVEDEEFPAAIDALLSIVLVAAQSEASRSASSRVAPSFSGASSAASSSGSVFSSIFRQGATEGTAVRDLIAEVERIVRGGTALADDTDPIACAEAFRLWLGSLPEPLVPSSSYSQLVSAGKKLGRKVVSDPRPIVPLIRNGGDEAVRAHHLPVLQGIMAVLSALVVAQRQADPELRYGPGPEFHGTEHHLPPRSRGGVLDPSFLARELGPLIIRPLGQSECPAQDRDVVCNIVEALIANHGLLEESVFPTPRPGEDPSDEPPKYEDGYTDESGYTARHGPGAPSRAAIARSQAAIIDAERANQAIFGGGDGDGRRKGSRNRDREGNGDKDSRRGNRSDGGGGHGDRDGSDDGFMSVFTGFFSEAPGDDGYSSSASSHASEGMFAMFLSLFADDTPKPMTEAERRERDKKKYLRRDAAKNGSAGNRDRGGRRRGSDASSSGSRGFNGRRNTGDRSKDSALQNRGSTRSIKARASSTSMVSRASSRASSRSRKRNNNADESFFGGLSSMLWGETADPGGYSEYYGDENV